MGWHLWLAGEPSRRPGYGKGGGWLFGGRVGGGKSFRFSDDDDVKGIGLQQPFGDAGNVLGRNRCDIGIAPCNIVDAKLVFLNGDENPSNPVCTVQGKGESPGKIGLGVGEFRFRNARFGHAFPFGADKLQRKGNPVIAGRQPAHQQANPVEGLDIRFGASYLDTEVKSDFPEFDGNELPNSPETQVTGTIRYEFPVSSGMSIALQADGKYSDKMFRESTNNPWLVTDSYSVVNLRASLLATDGSWELAMWGRNILDEEYEQERFASDIVGQVVGLQGNPLTYGLTLNYNL